MPSPVVARVVSSKMGATVYWTAILATAGNSFASVLPRQTSNNTVNVGSGSQSSPLLPSFFSYSLEFYFFPDYAGQLLHISRPIVTTT